MNVMIYFLGADFLGAPLTQFDIPLFWPALSQYPEYHWGVSVEYVKLITLLASFIMQIDSHYCRDGSIGLQNGECAPR